MIVYPKFVRWKHVKGLRIRKELYQKNLENAIKDKHSRIKGLQIDLQKTLSTLGESTTWMKRSLMKFSINHLISNKLVEIQIRHGRKLNNLIMEKRIQEGIHNNPNNLITNLTNVTLSNNKIEILKYGLKDSLAIRPKESEMIVIMEDIYEQILRHNVIKDSYISQERLKTALKGYTFNYLDVDDKRYIHDSKSLKVLRELREKSVILKPDKGQGIVLVHHGDYVNSMQRIFDDASEFKKIEKDPTITRLTTVQNYLKSLCKKGEITESERKAMRPKFAQIARADGLPKTHKPFEHLPKFIPVIDTTNTHYGISKFLSNLLNPLTENQYVVEDTFTAANKIREIPKELFNHDYRFFSFDVESLFTSVPLSKTINIILDRIYNKKLLKTNIKKRAMKKLLKDCCTKNDFSFNKTIYEQIDGVSMGSCLGPVLANIIMTELETVIVDKLFAANLLKFYICYVDDTLALLKESDINIVLKKLNSFHPSLKFTIDTFDDGIVHYLDIKIVDNETDIYLKDTHRSIHAFFFICSMAYKNSMDKSIISTSCKNL